MRHPTDDEPKQTAAPAPKPPSPGSEVFKDMTSERGERWWAVILKALPSGGFTLKPPENPRFFQALARDEGQRTAAHR